MTTDEVKTLVKKAYAAHNQTLYKTTQDTVFTVWEDLLGKYDMTVVYESFLDLTTQSVYLPTPGQIRKLVIEKLSKDTIPSALEAWATLQTVTQMANSGVPLTKPIHACLGRVMMKLGSQAYGLSTNFDRTHFVTEYDKTVAQYERERMHDMNNVTSAPQ